MIRVTVWGEDVHEHRDPAVRQLYPAGMHACIRDFLNRDAAIEARCATLAEPEHGLTAEVLARTEVLTWWGHLAHDQVEDRIVDRVQARVLEGMGLLVFHSGHYSKIFRRLMGTTCSLRWREADERERLWNCAPGHRITQGIGRCIELDRHEMYGEPFGIPTPDEQIFISWFEGGEVFRSGCTWRRGNGRVFYFSPGHETYPVFDHPDVQRVITNAVHWARQTSVVPDECPNVPREQAREAIGGSARTLRRR